ncbi:glycolate oxidase subunit GlcE [Xenophilus sp. Marseille-Q4582]|uniref:glycolate oxidase subunit GlcE n=1 Tax=Xenophilus sp. Marseille-Q4582 TaxID=2866600 RepID=UPI001CE47D04|nr:glycolate oxidase subunit GlcE [Xenophilus sp. Marseille-Q4582]
MTMLNEFIDRIRAASADGTPLVIRGGGSKDFYGEPVQGALLDTRALTGVLSYEPSELVVTVRAGTPLAELEAVLAQQNQCLPFEPPHFAWQGDGASATVGGMVAAGLSGPARASVGCVRDYVLGVGLINGRGEQLQFGGQVMKNVAGYDVSRVLAGSLGTLGLITELSLKVLPLAPAEATLEFTCTQAEALALLNGWGGQPLPLNASAWIAEAAAPDAPDSAPRPGVLWLRLRGAVAAVESACRSLGGLGGQLRAPEQAQPVWAALRDQRLPFFTDAVARGLALWRVSVPQTAPVLALPGQPLVEWHGGLRWYALPADQADAVRAAARQVGGHATLFVAPPGAATDAAPPRFDALSAPLARIHEGLRRSFDPAGIFNPGRQYARAAIAATADVAS